MGNGQPDSYHGWICELGGGWLVVEAKAWGLMKWKRDTECNGK